MKNQFKSVKMQKNSSLYKKLLVTFISMTIDKTVGKW